MLRSRPRAPPSPPTPDWHGTPRELGELSIVRKNRRQARAVIMTHQLGWEVRLPIGAQSEVVKTQVCRTPEEVLTTGEDGRKQWSRRDGDDVT